MLRCKYHFKLQPHCYFIPINLTKINNMVEVFNERKKGFEAKFKMDEEMEFKVSARRNKLLGLWLAEKLDLSESEHDAYATEVVLSDLEEAGIEDIIRKVMNDIENHGANLSESEVRLKLDEFFGIAAKELASK